MKNTTPSPNMPRSALFKSTVEGPHVRKAVEVLDNILRRMQTHQLKKQSMLRPLRVARRDPLPLRAPANSPSPGLGSLR